jgi:DNA polymerase-3 subunit delta'
MDSLLATTRPDLTAPQRTRLIDLADGSIGRALRLADAEGLAYADLADEVLTQLPTLSLSRMQTIADRVLRGDSGFTTFIDLLRRGLATAIRATAAGTQNQIGQNLATLRPLDAWSETWHTLGRLRDDTEHAYLDKRQAVISALRLLA